MLTIDLYNQWQAFERRPNNVSALGIRVVGNNAMDKKLLAGIVIYGKRYRDEMRTRYPNPDFLTHDAWQAMKFFFGRAFYQGRRDSLSTEVERRALAILDPRLSAVNGDIAQLDLRQVRTELSGQIGRGRVGKAGDVEMAISSLEFARKLPNRNVVAYSIGRIHAGGIGAHYEELQKGRSATGIYQVGPKIASFYLRDLVSLSCLEDKVPDDFQFCLQPIDVWVRRVVKSARMVTDSADDDQVRNAIMQVC